MRRTCAARMPAVAKNTDNGIDGLRIAIIATETRHET